MYRYSGFATANAPRAISATSKDPPLAIASLGPVLSIEVGLPLFLSGRLRAVGNIAIDLTEVTIGPYRCALMVFALTGKKRNN